MPMRAGHSANLHTLERALCLALATCGAAAVLAVPAVANTPPAPPKYSLSIVEGANTQPEDSIGHISASVSPKAEVAVSITHNGLVVGQDKGDGGAWLSQVPQVGDVVTRGARPPPKRRAR